MEGPRHSEWNLVFLHGLHRLWVNYNEARLILVEIVGHCQNHTIILLNTVRVSYEIWLVWQIVGLGPSCRHFLFASIVFNQVEAVVLINLLSTEVLDHVRKAVFFDTIVLPVELGELVVTAVWERVEHFLSEVSSLQI